MVKEDLIFQLVRNVLKTRYEDLDASMVEAVKKSVIDTLGCVIAGSSALMCPELVALLKDWGGKRECSVMVFGGKLPLPAALLANSTMARARDFDDVHEGGEGRGGGGHVSATSVPATLALAEYCARPVSGKEFILADAVGSDLCGRFRMALTSYHGWLAETFASLGVVAVGGKLLGFDEEKMVNGMGIAYAQCAGNAQAIVDGGLTVRLQQGLGARAGGLATVALAEKGFTGARDVLQGVYGLYPLYGRNEYDPAILVDKLGREFQITQVSVKPYPCQKGTHGAIYGVLELRRDNALKAADVEEVVITVNTRGYVNAGQGEHRYRPRTVVDAQFSIPYTVAVALLKGDVFISDFTDEAIKDERLLELARKVKVKADPELDKTPEIPPTTLDITTRDGKRYSKRVEFVKGHPRNPMTLSDCVEKFGKLLPFSARPLSETRVAKLIDLVDGLEGVKDVREMVKLVAQ